MLRHAREVDSTNAVVKRWGADGEPHGTALYADVQTRGRGRRGRSWDSQSGNLHLSVLLRPRLPLAQVPLLCLAAAVAVVEALPGLGLGIKWPNDVLAPDGRKLAGILAELELRNGRVDYVVVGIGVDVRTAPLPTATSLRELGVEVPVAQLAEAVTAGLLRACAALESDGAEAVLSPWRQHAHTLGRRVRVGAVEGIARDIDASGALVLNDGQRILAGDVEMIR